MTIDNKLVATVVGLMIAGILLLSTPVLAADENTTDSSNASSEDLFDALNEGIAIYNENLSLVPQLILTISGNDVIFVDIEMEDGSNLLLKAETNNGEISGFTEVSSASEVDSTAEIITTEATAWAILESETPLRTGVASIEAGDTEVEVNGFIKNAALRALLIMY